MSQRHKSKAGPSSGSAHLFGGRYPASPKALKPMRADLERALRKAHCSPAEIRDVVVAVNEACMNVIQHAYGGCCHIGDEFILEVERNADVLEIRVTDFADPINPEKIKPRALDDLRPGGLGVHFIREIMDEVCYARSEEGAGNRLIMKKKCR